MQRIAVQNTFVQIAARKFVDEIDARCRFHQRFSRAFFAKCNLKKDVRMKNAHEKCAQKCW